MTTADECGDVILQALYFARKIEENKLVKLVQTSFKILQKENAMDPEWSYGESHGAMEANFACTSDVQGFKQ